MCAPFQISLFWLLFKTLFPLDEARQGYLLKLSKTRESVIQMYIQMQNVTIYSQCNATSGPLSVGVA